MNTDIYQARRDHDSHWRAIRAAARLVDAVRLELPTAGPRAFAVLGKVQRMAAGLDASIAPPTEADRAVCEQLSAAVSCALTGHFNAAGAALEVAGDVADLHLRKAEQAFELELSAALARPWAKA